MVWSTLFYARYGARTHSPLGDIMVWSILFYARYGAIRFSVNQNHNALAIGHMGRGHYGLLLSLDKQASFGVSTWKQMLIQAKEIKDGGARWLACWVILWAPPLILDGYVMNDIWTTVQNKNHVCNL